MGGDKFVANVVEKIGLKFPFEFTCIYAMHREKIAGQTFSIRYRSMQDIRFNNAHIYILNLYDNKIYIIDVKVNGLKFSFQYNVLEDVSNKFVSAHCMMTSNV